MSGRSDPRVWLVGKRPCGYVRESTKKQADRYGPEIQKAAELRAAEQFGMRQLAEFYVDLVTGTSVLKRSDFRRMVEDARARRFDVLVVYDVSRFARNETDAWVYLDSLKDVGVPVYFCDEDILTIVDDDWRDQIGHAINAAASYSRKLSRNIRRGLERKRASGAYIGGVPWGYRFDEGKLRLVPTEDFATRQLIWELYASGEYSYKTLSDELNRRGRRIRDRLFTPYSVQEVLENDVDARLGQLDVALYQRAREIRAGRAGAAEKVGQRRRTYVFSSLARCGQCGERFWGRMNQRPDVGAERAYAQLVHAPRGCRRGTRSEAALGERFARWLDEWRLGALEKTRLQRFLERPQGDEDLAARRRQLERELGQLQKQHLWGHVSDEQYLRERRKVLMQMDRVALEQPVRPPVDAMALADRVGEVWRLNDDAWRRAFLSEWFAELRLASDGSMDVLPREPYRAIVAAAAPLELLVADAPLVRDEKGRWSRVDSNHRPSGCEPDGLTTDLRLRARESGTAGRAGLEPATSAM